jgi:hypothetical protein
MRSRMRIGWMGRDYLLNTLVEFVRRRIREKDDRWTILCLGRMVNLLGSLGGTLREQIAHREMALWIFDIDRDLLTPDGTFRTCRLVGSLDPLFFYHQLYNSKFGVWSRRSLRNLCFCLRNLTFLLLAFFGT